MTRHDEAVRRLILALGGLPVLIVLAMVTGTGALGGMAAAATPRFVTVAGQGGTGSLDAPSGIALDSSGDLFIADTDHCRVLLEPGRSGAMYGLRVQAGH